MAHPLTISEWETREQAREVPDSLERYWPATTTNTGQPLSIRAQQTLAGDCAPTPATAAPVAGEPSTERRT